MQSVFIQCLSDDAWSQHRDLTLMTGFVVQCHKWSVGHYRCFTSVFNAEATKHRPGPRIQLLRLLRGIFMTKFTWQQCFEKANFLKQVYIFQNKTCYCLRVKWQFMKTMHVTILAYIFALSNAMVITMSVIAISKIFFCIKNKTLIKFWLDDIA